MERSVTIENVKNIAYLKFSLPISNGVYLLVGPNGAGKTTLLVCLDRIGNSRAFADNFVTSPYNDQVDRYDDSAITYDVDIPELHFTFHKGSKRWTATPRIDSTELSKFGYSETVFIQANSKRIDVTSEDIRRGELVNVSQAIKTELNRLFETDKFDNLKRLKNTRGRGRTAQFFYVIQDGKKRYSEKRFSTGELALLRLVENLSNVQDNSLILLDEAEMALHPRIQQNLHRYLEEKAEEKHLTVIISTHSITMIKSSDKDHILLLNELDVQRIHGMVSRKRLEYDKKVYEVVCPCYPARAIGCVDYIQNAREDAIFFVEDEMAKLLLKKMLGMCTKEERYSTITAAVIPVGGYRETAKLALNTKDRVFTDAKVFAVWDQDVITDIEPKDDEIRKLHYDHKDVIFSLGCTPELWMIDVLESSDYNIGNVFRDVFRTEINTILASSEYKKCKGDNPSKVAKAKLNVFIEKITCSTGEPYDSVIEQLTSLLLNNARTEGEIKAVVMPMLRRIR